VKAKLVQVYCAFCACVVRAAITFFHLLSIIFIAILFLAFFLIKIQSWGETGAGWKKRAEQVVQEGAEGQLGRAEQLGETNGTEELGQKWAEEVGIERGAAKE